MEEGTLGYEIEHYYKNCRFVRGDIKFVDSQGRVYSPIDLVGADEMNIDVGDTGGQVPIKPHLGDRVLVRKD